MSVPQSFLELALLGDIGVRAEPARNFPVSVKNGQRPRQKPAIFSTLAPERERIFPWLAGPESDLQAFDHSSDFIRVMHFLPAPALHLFERRAGVIIPSVVVPK